MKYKKWCFNLVIVILGILGLHQKACKAIETIDPYSFYQGSDLILTNQFDGKPEVKTNISSSIISEADYRYIVGSGSYNKVSLPQGCISFVINDTHLSSDKYIQLKYTGVGIYNNKKIDVIMNFHSFSYKKSGMTGLPTNQMFLVTGFELVKEGIFFMNIRDFENTISLQYQDGSKLPISDTNPIYLSFNSLNTGEYIGLSRGAWLRAIPNNNIGIKKDTLKNYELFAGLNNNFPDGQLEVLEFYKNSVIAKFTSSSFTVVQGSESGLCWSPFSAKLLWLPEPTSTQPAITKSVTNALGEAIDNGQVRNGEKIDFTVKFKVESLEKMPLKYKSLVITDNISTHLTLNKAPVIIDSSGNIVPINHYNFDELTGTITFNSIGLNNLEYKGEYYSIVYSTSIKSGNEAPDKTVISNKASINYNQQKTFESNTVNVSVKRPKITINIEDISIDTKPVNCGGLPVKINLKRGDLIYENDLDQLVYRITLEDVTDKNKAFEVYSKDFTGTEKFETKAISANISTKNLAKNQQRKYQATVSVVSNPNDYAIFTTSTINLATHGYTASEKELTSADIIVDKINYSAVVRTIKERSKADVIEQKETITIPMTTKLSIKSGYGLERKLEINYSIDELTLKPNLDNIFMTVAPEALLNKDTFVPYTKTSNSSNGEIKLDETKRVSLNNKELITYEFPKVQSEKITGAIFTDAQVSSSDSQITTGKNLGFVFAGRKFYIPIWAEIKHYLLGFQSDKAIGVNAISLAVTQDLNVYAQMQCTIDSKTQAKDELIVIPVFPNSYNPSTNYIDSAKEWFREPLENDWHGTKYALNSDNAWKIK